MKTVNITDYTILSPVLAKVIISFTGDCDPEFLKNELSAKMGRAAAPVAASFKKIRDGVAVGFVKANKEVRTVTDKEIKAGYRIMSSNVLMSNDDKKLWEIKTSAGNKYLTRHGQEDLSELVESAVQRRQDVPKLSHITIARAAAKELVAFVDQDGDMDYGFALATNDEKAKILSFNRRIPTVVAYNQVVSIQPVVVPTHIHNQIVASMTPEEKKDANAYWTKLYSWAPDYLRELTKYVNEGTVA